VTVEVIVCGGCGAEFGVEARRLEELRETGETFYCPNGHSRRYTVGPTKDQKRIAELERSLRSAWERAGHWQQAHREAVSMFRRCPLCLEVVTRARDEERIAARIAEHLIAEHGARPRMRAIPVKTGTAR